MYKKYIHPKYNWYNKTYKQLDENCLISHTGEITTLDYLKLTVKKDEESFDPSERTEPKYGIVEINELEYMDNVFEHIKDLKKNIADAEVELKKYCSLLGVEL